MTDLIETAISLNELMQDIDHYNYMDCEYSKEQAIADLNDDPYYIIQELITIIRDFMN